MNFGLCKINYVSLLYGNYSNLTLPLGRKFVKFIHCQICNVTCQILNLTKGNAYSIGDALTQ